ncbi:unnamed protein product, partial [marine sediment metagenome]
EMLKSCEHFSTLWDYLRTERRRLILYLCYSLRKKSDPIDLDLIKACFEEAGVIVPRNERLGDDIKFLQEMELVEYIKGHRGPEYRISIPLMENWIELNIDGIDIIENAKIEGEERAL